MLEHFLDQVKTLKIARIGFLSRRTAIAIGIRHVIDAARQRLVAVAIMGL
jgi:hypothetical protein